MTHLNITNQFMPAADLGLQNPLPPLNRGKGTTKPLVVHESVPIKSRRYLGYGVSADVADPALPCPVVGDSIKARVRGRINVATAQTSWKRSQCGVPTPPDHANRNMNMHS